jgi:hypothetical protein
MCLCGAVPACRADVCLPAAVLTVDVSFVLTGLQYKICMQAQLRRSQFGMKAGLISVV